MLHGDNRTTEQHITDLKNPQRDSSRAAANTAAVDESTPRDQSYLSSIAEQTKNLFNYGDDHEQHGANTASAGNATRGGPVSDTHASDASHFERDPALQDIKTVDPKHSNSKYANYTYKSMVDPVITNKDVEESERRVKEISRQKRDPLAAKDARQSSGDYAGGASMGSGSGSAHAADADDKSSGSGSGLLGKLGFGHKKSKSEDAHQASGVPGETDKTYNIPDDSQYQTYFEEVPENQQTYQKGALGAGSAAGRNVNIKSRSQGVGEGGPYAGSNTLSNPATETGFAESRNAYGGDAGFSSKDPSSFEASKRGVEKTTGDDYAQGAGYTTGDNYTSKDPYANKDSYGSKDSYGKDSYGKDSYGKDSYGKDSYGNDSYGKDPYVKDSYGKDSYGKDSYGKDSYGKDSLDKESYGARNSGISSTQNQYVQKGALDDDSKHLNKGTEHYGDQTYGSKQYGDDLHHDSEHNENQGVWSSITNYLGMGGNSEENEGAEDYGYENQMPGGLNMQDRGVSGSHNSQGYNRATGAGGAGLSGNAQGDSFEPSLTSPSGASVSENQLRAQQHQMKSKNFSAAQGQNQYYGEAPGENKLSSTHGTTGAYSSSEIPGKGTRGTNVGTTGAATGAATGAGFASGNKHSGNKHLGKKDVTSDLVTDSTPYRMVQNPKNEEYLKSKNSEGLKVNKKAGETAGYDSLQSGGAYGTTGQNSASQPQGSKYLGKNQSGADHSNKAPSYGDSQLTDKSGVLLASPSRKGKNDGYYAGTKTKDNKVTSGNTSGAGFASGSTPSTGYTSGTTPGAGYTSGSTPGIGHTSGKSSGAGYASGSAPDYLSGETPGAGYASRSSGYDRSGAQISGDSYEGKAGQGYTSGSNKGFSGKGSKAGTAGTAGAIVGSGAAGESTFNPGANTGLDYSGAGAATNSKQIPGDIESKANNASNLNTTVADQNYGTNGSNAYTGGASGYQDYDESAGSYGNSALGGSEEKGGQFVRDKNGKYDFKNKSTGQDISDEKIQGEESLDKHKKSENQPLNKIKNLFTKDKKGKKESAEKKEVNEHGTVFGGQKSGQSQSEGSNYPGSGSGALGSDAKYVSGQGGRDYGSDANYAVGSGNETYGSDPNYASGAGGVIAGSGNKAFSSDPSHSSGAGGNRAYDSNYTSGSGGNKIHSSNTNYGGGNVSGSKAYTSDPTYTSGTAGAPSGSKAYTSDLSHGSGSGGIKAHPDTTYTSGGSGGRAYTSDPSYTSGTGNKIYTSDPSYVGGAGNKTHSSGSNYTGGSGRGGKTHASAANYASGSGKSNIAGGSKSHAAGSGYNHTSGSKNTTADPNYSLSASNKAFKDAEYANATSARGKNSEYVGGVAGAGAVGAGAVGTGAGAGGANYSTHNTPGAGNMGSNTHHNQRYDDSAPNYEEGGQHHRKKSLIDTIKDKL